MRVSLGIVYTGCVYGSIKYLPLVVTSLIQNLSPLYTALLSYKYMNKGLNRLEIVILIESFVGVIMLITGKV